MKTSKKNTRIQRQTRKKKNKSYSQRQMNKNAKRKQRKQIKHNRSRKQKNKRNKKMKGGSWPFSGMGNLISMGAYQANNALTPLHDRTVDNSLTNPNYSSQFPIESNDPNLVTGPKLSVYSA